MRRTRAGDDARSGAAHELASSFHNSIGAFIMNRHSGGTIIGTVIGALLLLSCATVHAEQRCGYYISSAPNDLELIDKDATWTIKTPNQQSGKDADGLGNLPSVSDRRYMFRHFDTRIGCACLNVETDAKTARITRVDSGKGISWKRCESDKTLPKPD
ncbi:DUF4087 domain-containing protein [Burkholderia cepacia]|uniref:DUF4087 domain-containing protein n=1 Tax=Burkholderia cepacia TaxID=292 RepID=UPI00158B89CD|nr:DUF4087 domain-containing protein [Burkholderia cepacia]